MDVKVTAIGEHSSSLETIIRDVSNVIDAKNKFARQKGYSSYGDMVVAYQDKGKQKPPYSFTKIDKVK